MATSTLRILAVALVSGGIAAGCGSNVSDAPDDDSGTVPDGSRGDARAGDGSGDNKDAAGTDSSVADSSVDDGSTDDGSADADDSSTVDSSIPDSGMVCPVCTKLDACCTLTTSKNFGKCEPTLCLACCM